jgi:hypothetical protein
VYTRELKDGNGELSTYFSAVDAQDILQAKAGGRGAPRIVPVAPLPPTDVASSSAEEAAPPESRGKRRGGRPKGTTEDWQNRVKAMLEGWDRGDYGDNKAEAGRAHDFHRPDACKIINAHEREKRRNNSQR